MTDEDLGHWREWLRRVQQHLKRHGEPPYAQDQLRAALRVGDQWMDGLPQKRFWTAARRKSRVGDSRPKFSQKSY